MSATERHVPTAREAPKITLSYEEKLHHYGNYRGTDQVLFPHTTSRSYCQFSVLVVISS